LADYYTYGGGNISQVWMTEGSWNGNCNFSANCTSYSPSPTVLQDMRAYIARYSLVTAATLNTSPTLNVTSQFWFGWEGDINNPEDFNGTGCDGDYVTVGMITYPTALPCETYETGSPSYYAGYAYGQVIDWLAGGSIGACNTTLSGGCVDGTSDVWSYPVMLGPSSTTAGLVAWVWDNPATTCSSTSTATTGCPNFSSFGHYKNLEGTTVAISHTSGSTVTLTIEPYLFY
jgi:hypothetical protein